MIKKKWLTVNLQKILSEKENKLIFKTNDKIKLPLLLYPRVGGPS